MKFNLKNIVGGGLLFYVTMFIVGMVVGQFIHQGVLESAYEQTQAFWRPELNQDPPDLSSLMPQWITVGLITAFIWAGIYDNIRGSLAGGGVLQGVKFGLLMGLIFATFAAAYSGVFNLPNTIWIWWSVEGFINYAIGGAVLGWFIGKWGGA